MGGCLLVFVTSIHFLILRLGQTYVALSRATTLDGLQVLGFNPSKVRLPYHYSYDKQLISYGRSKHIAR